MVEFRKKVVDSDPHLFDKFMNNIDLFQRKGVALYHEALRKHGHKDIWAEGVLGRQLLEWFNRVKESTDALYTFLTSGRFQFNSTLYMPLEDFKQDYFEFRRNGGHDKIRWNAEHYDAVFQETGLCIIPDSREYPKGSSNAKVQKPWILGLDVHFDDEGA